MKKIKFLLLLTAVLTIVSACSNTSDTGKTSEPTEVDGWIITTSKFELVDNLANSISSQQYNGGSIEVEYKEKPAEGMLFGLVKLNIEKSPDAVGNFSWDNACIMDENGNEYQRHANDTFLTNYNFKRIKSIDLTLGTSEGYACYEISNAAEKSKLYFVYKGMDETVKIPLN